MIYEEEGELEEDDDKEEAGQENREEQVNEDLYRKLIEDELSDSDVVDFFKVLLQSKNSVLFFFQIFKACLFYTSLAKFYASNFIQNLFSLSASFGFHSPPLLTFKID